MAKWLRLGLLVLAAAVAAQWWSGQGDGASRAPTESSRTVATARDSRYPSFLPPEAVTTLQRIERGGPFPYDRDGTVFQNREGRLPDRPRGYYREYTVPTPGSPDRGARRIVTGGQPPEAYYYTDDHYRTFRRLEITP